MQAWITYAWVDNEVDDVDFVIQELRDAGIDIRFDRESLVPGQRLWSQIGAAIEDPDCDGWIMYATRSAFESEAVLEELAYAIDRTISTRGDDFPLIALFADSASADLPVSLRIRLGVPLADSDWVDRIVAGLRLEAPTGPAARIEPFYLRIHEQNSEFSDKWCIEVRPRAGRWCPLFFAVSASDSDKLDVVRCGPRDLPTGTHMVISNERQSTPDEKWFGLGITDEATPTRSIYAYLTDLPTEVAFGVPNGPNWTVKIPRSGVTGST